MFLLILGFLSLLTHNKTHSFKRVKVRKVHVDFTTWISSWDSQKSGGVLKSREPKTIVSIPGWWFGCHQFGIFPEILGCFHHPNWRSHIFQRGFSQAPTSHSFNTTKSCKQRNESYDSDDLGVSLRRSFPEGFFDRVPIYPLGPIDFIPLISMWFSSINLWIDPWDFHGIFHDKPPISGIIHGKFPRNIHIENDSAAEAKAVCPSDPSWRSATCARTMRLGGWRTLVVSSLIRNPNSWQTLVGGWISVGYFIWDGFCRI